MLDLREYCENMPLTGTSSKELLKKIRSEFDYLRQRQLLEDSAIHATAVIEPDCLVGRGVSVGPYSYVRGGSVLDDGCIVGHCCEVARSYIGPNSRITHKVTMADCFVGNHVNIGALVSLSPYSIFEIKTFCESGKELIARPVLLGDRSIVGSNCSLGPNLFIGTDCVIYPNLVMANRIIESRKVIKASNTSEALKYSIICGPFK